MKPASSFVPNRQHGAVLFVALVFLLLLTLLGVTASSTSVLQERMTGGMRNAQLAMHGHRKCASRRRDRSVDRRGAIVVHRRGGLAIPPCGPAACSLARTAHERHPDQRSRSSARRWKQWLAPAATARSRTPDSQRAVSDKPPHPREQPRYLIEDLGLDTEAAERQHGRLDPFAAGPRRTERSPFRVTSRSQGGSNTLLRVARACSEPTPSPTQSRQLTVAGEEGNHHAYVHLQTSHPIRRTALVVAAIAISMQVFAAGRSPATST